MSSMIDFCGFINIIILGHEFQRPCVVGFACAAGSRREFTIFGLSKGGEACVLTG